MNLDFLADRLNERKHSGNLRRLLVNEDLVDFVSNDYLGLARSSELSQIIQNQILVRPELPNGGTGSRLLSGNFSLYQETEKYLADLFRSEACLLFNSGYMANQAVVSSVAGKGDTVLYDQLSHVCLKEGAWLSGAETNAFRHNDLQDLKERLSRTKGRVFVLTETIFSMDGDVCPIREMIDLCKSHGAYLVVDEAHSTGLFGKGGAGVLVENGLQDDVFARIYTFGKGMGVHGACVAGPKILRDFLVNFGRSFIYTTSLPPHSVLSIFESFKFLSSKPELPTELNDRIALFRNGFKAAVSHTAIQPVIIGDNLRARSIALQLQEAGLDVRPILSPTVAKGTERLRIILHVHNTEEEINRLTTELTALIAR